MADGDFDIKPYLESTDELDPDQEPVTIDFELSDDSSTILEDVDLFEE